MNRILFYAGGVSIISILMFAMVISVSFYISGNEANAQDCDAFIDYFVDENGNGTCTVGLGGGDFLNGTGVAKCAFARNGNISCTCKGEHMIPLESALILDPDDDCCIYIGADDPIRSEITMGLGTPSGIVNATCKHRPE